VKGSLLRLIRVLVTGKAPAAPSCCECDVCCIVRKRRGAEQ